MGRALNGLAGNAGLFSTAADLARFAAMIANGGELDGVRMLRRETIDTFLRPQPGAGSFALGWVTYCREGKVPDHVACKDVYAIGHTGSHRDRAVDRPAHPHVDGAAHQPRLRAQARRDMRASAAASTRG